VVVFVVGPVGVEPTTNGLKGHCSTIELQTRVSNKIESLLSIFGASEGIVSRSDTDPWVRHAEMPAFLWGERLGLVLRSNPDPTNMEYFT
jgi:hypothetical protein